MRGASSKCILAVMLAVGFSQLGATGCPSPTKLVHTVVLNVVPGYDAMDEVLVGPSPGVVMDGPNDMVEVNSQGALGQFYYNGTVQYPLQCVAGKQYGFRQWMEGSGGTIVYKGPGTGVADNHSTFTEWACPLGQGSIDNNGVRWAAIDANCNLAPVCKVGWDANYGQDPPADPVQTVTNVGLKVPNPGLPWQPMLTGDLALGPDGFDCGSYGPGICFGGPDVTGSGEFEGCLKAVSGDATMPMAGADVWVTSFATNNANAVKYVTGEDGCFTVRLGDHLAVLPQL